MAILAEEIVEEWLNRQGYFTIRGVKLGVHEVDLLAVKPTKDGSVECRHLEVQASMRPVSYICRVPKELQKNGRAPNSAKRSDQELIDGVSEWVDKKFRNTKKQMLMQALWKGTWSSELVLNVVKSPYEVELIQKHGIKIIWLKSIVSSFLESGTHIQSAAGGDFIDLLHLGTQA